MTDKPTALAAFAGPKATFTAMQSRFIEAYLNNPNAAAAARLAGYSKKAAAQTGHSLMKLPKIRDEIKRRGDFDAGELGISRAYILSRINEVVQRERAGTPRLLKQKRAIKGPDGEWVEDWYERDPNTGEIRVDYNPRALLAALELLAKLRGDLIERSEVKTLTVEMVLNDVNVEDLK
ncbi:MAG: terminase small subunit [Pseudomonadota bacterium]|nr:terminase small subunit [Pseudomonadota bacterium]